MSQHGLQGNKLYCIYLILYLFNSTNFQVYHFHIAHNTPYIPPPPPSHPHHKNLENGFFQMPSHAHVCVKKTKGKIPGEYITWSELGKPNIQAEGDVTIATTIFSAILQRSNIVATWFRLVATLNIAMLCCAKNRRWESSHVSLHVTSRRPCR